MSWKTRDGGRRPRRRRRTATDERVEQPAARTRDGASPESVAGQPATRPKATPRHRPRGRVHAGSLPAGRNMWLVVGVLTLVALVVRLPGINVGLWNDEIYSILYSFRTPFPDLLAEFRGDNKHPLYALLAHAGRAVFGETAAVVRLPALLFGVATVPLLYALGTRIASRAESLAAAALLALSYHHAWFSQSARSYTMLAFGAVLTTLLILRAFEGAKLRTWLWYGVVAGLGAYTHLTFVFTVVAQAIVAAAAVAGFPRGEPRVNWRLPLIGFGTSALVALALYAPMLPDVLAFFLHQESNLKGISSPLWALGEAMRVLRLGFGGAFGVGLVVLGIAAAVGIAGLVSYVRQSHRTALLLTLPALATLGGALLARGTMYPRFFFLLAGLALLIGMRGAFVTGGWLARRLGRNEAAGHAIGAVLATLVITASALSLPLNWRAPKQDYEGAMRYIEAESVPGDAIATADVTAEIYQKFYQKPWRAMTTASDLDALRAETSQGRAVWFVYTFPRYLATFDAALASAVDRDCRDARIFHGTVGGGDVYVCRLSGRASPLHPGVPPR